MNSPISLEVLLLLVPQDEMSRPMMLHGGVPEACNRDPPAPSICRPVLTLPPALPAVNIGTPSSEWMRASDWSVLAMIRHVVEQGAVAFLDFGEGVDVVGPDSIDRRVNQDTIGW
jgi:hypothetical protein